MYWMKQGVHPFIRYVIAPPVFKILNILCDIIRM